MKHDDAQLRIEDNYLPLAWAESNEEQHVDDVSAGFSPRARSFSGGTVESTRSWSSRYTEVGDKLRLLRQRSQKLVRSTRKVLLKRARVSVYLVKAPSEIESLFFLSTSAKAIYACIILSLLSKHLIFLYGVLAVMWTQICWIVLKWTLYIFDDPDLRVLQSFIKGWLRVFMREGRHIIQSKSSRSMWLAGNVARHIPMGVNLVRVFLRQYSQSVNHQLMEEFRQRVHHFSRSPHA